jgi:hypothetical protein
VQIRELAEMAGLVLILTTQNASARLVQRPIAHMHLLEFGAYGNYAKVSRILFLTPSSNK